MELYRFKTKYIDSNDGNTKIDKIYRFTNNKEDYFLQNDDFFNDNQTYKAIFIEKNEINLELGNDIVKVSTHIFYEPFAFINNFILNKNLEIEIFKIYKNNDNTIKKVKLYRGYAINYEIEIETKKIIIHCSNISNLFNTKRPARKFDSGCNFKLYGQECSAVKNNYLTNINVSNISISTDRKTLNVSETLAVNNFANGILEINNAKQSISIVSNTANQINLLFPIFNDVSEIENIKIYFGCNKTLDSCKNKFNNIENFGGFPFIPAKNPAQGF